MRLLLLAQSRSLDDRHPNTKFLSSGGPHGDRHGSVAEWHNPSRQRDKQGAKPELHFLVKIRRTTIFAT
jgi:hypothetical protein